MSPRIAFSGVALGLAAAAYIGIVLLPVLSPPGRPPFPPCPTNHSFFKFTTKGAVEPVDRFMCMVLPFFVEATKTPFAAWNWAELLLSVIPLGVHALEASTTARRSFWALLVPAFVAALGQLIGISIAFPLLGLPAYALSGAAKLSKRETSLPVAWGIIFVSLAFILPLAFIFVFPHGSEAWIATMAIFQFAPPLMFLALLPLAICCREPGASYRPRAKAHALLLGTFGLYAGICIVAHVLACTQLAAHSGWSWPAVVDMAHAAWDDMHIRFLLVDHAVLLAAIALMIILDGGVGALLLTVLMSPFLSVGGAVSLFYARPHMLWFLGPKDGKQE